ncbi:unnamed protein product [Lupinus luteus]|uniref:Transmembrane protein n=1 Tax=Lupinus luteus TaxID=3873 RepID=A0AAV1YMS2_LUPLU
MKILHLPVLQSGFYDPKKVFFSISKPFPSLLTLCITLLSTMFLVTLTKKKGSQEQNLVHVKLQKKELQNSIEDAKSCYPFPSDTESSSFLIMDKKLELNVQDHEQQADSQSDYSLPSDSESSTGSIMCGSFEIDHNGNQNVSISDNLASKNDDYDDEEEDSLIEIELPRSLFYDLPEEPKQTSESKLPDFLPGSIFKEQGLMELLDEINEMNEDENLIEIDISLGSTNGQDYRLKKEFATLLGDQYVLSE